MSKNEITWGSQDLSMILECLVRVEVISPDFVISLIKIMYAKTKTGTTFIEFNIFAKL